MVLFTRASAPATVTSMSLWLSKFSSSKMKGKEGSALMSATPARNPRSRVLPIFVFCVLCFVFCIVEERKKERKKIKRGEKERERERKERKEKDYCPFFLSIFKKQSVYKPTNSTSPLGRVVGFKPRTKN